MATIFAVLDLAFHDALQPEPTDERASTVPFPADIGRYRGSPPTFVVDLQASFEETPNAIRDFHDLGQQLPSIYRTFVQWTSYLERAWADLGPVFESTAFDKVRARADDHVDGFVSLQPYNAPARAGRLGAALRRRDRRGPPEDRPDVQLRRRRDGPAGTAGLRGGS